MSTLLQEDDRERAMDEVEAPARDEGPGPAMQRMMAVIGVDPSTTVFEAGAAPAPRSDTAAADLATYFAHDLAAVRAATLVPADISATGRAALTVAGGVRSRNGWEYRCAQALALDCGLEILELPGAHNGAVTHPRGVATALGAALASS